MSESKHSPLPWSVLRRKVGADADEIGIGYDGDGGPVVCGVWPMGVDFEHTNGNGPVQKLNAELIVNSVNNHTSLVNALKAAYEALEELTSEHFWGFEDGWKDPEHNWHVEVREVHEALKKVGAL